MFLLTLLFAGLVSADTLTYETFTDSSCSVSAADPVEQDLSAAGTTCDGYLPGLEAQGCQYDTCCNIDSSNSRYSCTTSTSGAIILDVLVAFFVSVASMLF